MPDEQPPSLTGDFAGRSCILASYPERAAQLQSEHKEARGAEGPHSYIPFPRNPLFQPRPGEFEHLEMLLSGEHTGQPARIGLVGVTGMGGIGKTQLAIELAYRLQELHHFPDGIFWTPTTGNSVFEWQHDMAVLAFNADYLPPDDDLSSPENEARRARYFCRYLASHADALLILDNVEDPNLIISALPVLAGGSLACSILYTSRTTHSPQGVIVHLVEQLSEHASLHLLLETTRLALLSETLAGSQSAEAHATRLVCQMVGYLPLALVHLRSSFLERDRQVSLCRVVEALTKHGVLGIAAIVIETFRLSWEKVHTEEARRMFLLASYFPEAAPISLWLLGLASGLGEDEDIFEPLGQARFELRELSLLEELSNEQVRLHPLVRAFGQQLVGEMADQGIDLRQEAGQRLVEVGTDLNWLEALARKKGYEICLEHVREMLTYTELLDIDIYAEPLRRMERILDQESYLFVNEQWWPQRLTGLFYQQLYNRAMETGQPVKSEEVPLRWLRQTKPIGAEKRCLLRILAGHTERVNSVAFSPDGQRVLTGSEDQTARLWEVSSAKELVRFQGHTRWVNSVAFSSDGKYVLTGSGDQTARLWELNSAKELVRFQGHTDSVSSVAFSPNGKRVLTGSDDGTAVLWELSSGTQLTKFAEHSKWVSSVAFSPDGKLVLTGSGDSTARLWELSSAKELIRFSGHTSAVNSVAFSPDSKYVLTGSDDHTARLWELSNGREQVSFIRHTEAVYSVAFSPDGKLVLTGSGDHTAQLWELDNRRGLTQFIGHIGEVNGVAFSPDGRWVLTGSEDHTAQLWELSSGRIPVKFQEHANHRVYSVAFSPDGKWLLTGSDDNTARVWEVSSGRDQIYFKEHTHWVCSTAFSPDSKWALTGSADSTARVWEMSSGREQTCFQRHTSVVSSVAFSPDGKLVLTGSWDKTARLWEMSSGKEQARLEGHTHAVYEGTFSPDGKLVLTGSGDCTVRLWEVSSGRELVQFVGHTDRVGSVAFSPDGKRVLTSSDDRTARLWETNTGREEAQLVGHTDQLVRAVFSPDGCLAITCDMNGYIFFWRIDDLEAKGPLAVYVAHYPIAAMYWQDKTHVILADTGGPRNYPYFYYLELEGMG